MKSSSFLRVLGVVGLLTPLLIAACGDDDPTPSGPPGTSGRGGNGGRGGSAGSGTAGAGIAGSGTAGSGTAGAGTAGSGVAGSDTAGQAGAGGSPSGPENTNALCSDGVDNDGDGFIDCDDFNCTQNNPAVTVCGGNGGAGGGGGGTGAENSNAACKDGVDNDGNGFTDCKDFGCRYFPVTGDVCPEAGEASNDDCTDGVDNDNDGFIDCKDFSCSKSPNVTVCDNTGGSGGASGSGGGGAGGAGGQGGGGAAGAGGKGGSGGGGGGSGGGKIVINELVFNPPEDPEKGCYVELKGPPGASLANYELRPINGSNGQKYNDITFDATHKFDANGYFVIAQDATVVLPPGAAFIIDTGAQLQNGPDSVTLRDPSGEVIDAIGYATIGGTFEGPFFAGEGKFALQPSGLNASDSLSRLPDGSDTNDNATDFGIGAKTPGAPNVAVPSVTATSRVREVRGSGGGG